MMDLSERSRYAGNVIEEDDAFAENLLASGKKIIKLNRGDPVAYFPTPKYMINAYIDALKNLKTGYSFHAGIRQLRHAISERHRRLYNLKTGEEHVIVTQGVSESIMFMNSLLINNGDKAVIFRPYYPLYMSSLLIEGGVPINVDYSESEGNRIDSDDLRRSLKKYRKKSIKYMIFANPGNPTGHVMNRNDLKEIADIANDNDIFIISDEIYDEIVYNGAKFTSISEVSKGVPTAIFGGASKSFDATGFRIGYTIIPENDKVSESIRQKLADYAKMRLSSNTPAQFAFTEAINNVEMHGAAVKEMVKEIELRANFATDLLNQSEYLNAERPSGAFYVFAKVNMKKLKLKDDKELVRKLLVEEGVQVTRGSGFGAQNCIRIVSLPTKDILELAIRKIDKFLVRHSR